MPVPRRLLRRLAKAPNYVSAFGLVPGMRLLSSLERPLDSQTTRKRRYAVPGYPDRIHLRETVSDHATFWQCIVQRQYDLSSFPQAQRVLQAYRESLERGARPLIIDCGGNIGLSALYLGRMFPEARICVVEPDPANFALLQANTASLGARVTALQGGIWSESGFLRIANPEAGSAAFRVERADEGPGTVRAYTIDELCRLAGVDAPLVVKIDIEGTQGELFRARTGWVANTHLIMLELDDWLMPWQGTSRPFFACLSRYPFDYLIRGETIFCFRDFLAQ